MLSKVEIFLFLRDKGVYYKKIEMLILALQNYDPMLDIHYFVGEAYIKFTSDENIGKMKNESILARSFLNFVTDIYRREFSTWKVKKVDNISLFLSDSEKQLMREMEFNINEKYLYAYILGRSTCFRLGLNFIRGKDKRINKFRLCKNLALLIKKIYESIKENEDVMATFKKREIDFIRYVSYKEKSNMDFIKKNGKISMSLKTNYSKKIAKKLFLLIEEGDI